MTNYRFFTKLKQIDNLQTQTERLKALKSLSKQLEKEPCYTDFEKQINLGQQQFVVNEATEERKQLTDQRSAEYIENKFKKVIEHVFKT